MALNTLFEKFITYPWVHNFFFAPNLKQSSKFYATFFSKLQKSTKPCSRNPGGPLHYLNIFSQSTYPLYHLILYYKKRSLLKGCLLWLEAEYFSTFSKFLSVVYFRKWVFKSDKSTERLCVWRISWNTEHLIELHSLLHSQLKCMTRKSTLMLAFQFKASRCLLRKIQCWQETNLSPGLALNLGLQHRGLVLAGMMKRWKVQPDYQNNSRQINLHI